MSVIDAASYLGVTAQGIHQKLKLHSLQANKAQNKTYFSHETAKDVFNIKLDPIRIAMAVVKGGVGKTTLVEAIAVRLALYGLRILLVDLDQQANLTIGLGMASQAASTPVMIDLIEGKEKPENAVLNVIPGLDLIPSRLDNVTLDNFMMINRVNPQLIFQNLFSEIYKNYDVVLFDCPPTLGSTVCAAILASDLLIAPMNPDVYSYEGIEIMNKEIEHIESQFQREIDWKILLNKFDSRTFLSGEYLKDVIKDEKYEKRLLSSVIKNSMEFPKMKNKGKTIFDTLRATTAKDDIDGVVKELILMTSVENSQINTNLSSATGT
jgi:chromosome partitioning protein